MNQRPDDHEAPETDHWRGAGERIDTLLGASSAAGAVARERAEQLVGEVVGLYGAGLERIMRLLDPDAVEQLARDELVASLLLVHGLHPHDAVTRVRTALDGVRPYLGSHGGDVDVLEVTDGVVRLAFSGSCRTCPSSSVTLELAVEDAVRAAAPEIETIEVVATESDSSPKLIPADSLLARVHGNGNGNGNGHHGGTWIGAPELAQLGTGEVGGFALAGTAVLACRVGDELFVYRDHCPSCGNSMAGAVLHRRPGHAIGDAVLRCPVCRAHFDAVHAGARLDGDGHLEPLPVLMRSGTPEVAVPVEAAG
ncbi:NifU family protein [Nocardia sp. NPDC059240]|uniref:NifU family protein n=1 Tax=Nocardia sp. NPDC059240 TaxID=3346786 RepID=UPI0036949E0A